MKLKTFILILSVGIIVSVLTGCLVRTYPKTVERIDLEIQNAGNQGYLWGIPPDDVEVEKTTRTIQVIEVEIGKPVEVEPKSKIETQNQVLGESYEYAETEIEEELEDIVYASEIREETQNLPETYLVQANDTLQKIAARPEIYGSYKKWRKIYDANRDKLSSPEKIYPGQTLRIPRD